MSACVHDVFESSFHTFGTFFPVVIMPQLTHDALREKAYNATPASQCQPVRNQGRLYQLNRIPVYIKI